VITTSLIMTFSLIQNGIGIKSAEPEYDITGEEESAPAIEESTGNIQNDSGTESSNLDADSEG
jgi:hypothetical protein